MSSELDSPEQLVERISESAAELSPVQADAFREMALNNIALFRDERRADSPIGFSIPRTYASDPETFIVFDAFVGVFLRPVELALSNLELLRLLEGPSSLSFARLDEGTEPEATLRVTQLLEWRAVRDELRSLTQSLERTYSVPVLI
jgi:hypothetical protein